MCKFVGKSIRVTKLNCKGVFCQLGAISRQPCYWLTQQVRFRNDVFVSAKPAKVAHDDVGLT